MSDGPAPSPPHVNLGTRLSPKPLDSKCSVIPHPRRAVMVTRHDGHEVSCARRTLQSTQLPPRGWPGGPSLVPPGSPLHPLVRRGLVLTPVSDLRVEQHSDESFPSRSGASS